MDEMEFDLFDFARAEALKNDAVQPVECDSAESTAACEKTLSKTELRQAAIAFLATLKPHGIAANVPTRRSKYRVAAAGFWRPANQRQNHTVSQTAIVVMYDDLDCCFSDCSDREKRIAEISSLQDKKETLEAEIRLAEPHLAATDDLFGEFRTWDYQSSSNTEYRKVCRKLEKELKILTHGSKLEYIRRAGNADFCYLAVPENFIDPAVIPAEWGIVELVSSPRSFRLIRTPLAIREVSPEGRLQLALNIAAAAAPSACFAAGVDSDGKMRRPPKKRKVRG